MEERGRGDRKGLNDDQDEEAAEDRPLVAVRRSSKVRKKPF